MSDKCHINVDPKQHDGVAGESNIRVRIAQHAKIHDSALLA
jgi:hypothetical protein